MRMCGMISMVAAPRSKEPISHGGYPSAIRAASGCAEMGVVSGVVASGSKCPLSTHRHHPGGQIVKARNPPGEAIRDPSRPSTALDPEPTAQADPELSFTTSPAAGRVWPRSGHSHHITGQAQRVEIISAKEPRRRWSDEEKRRLGADVLRRINGHPASRLDELLPWNWKGRSARLVA